MGPMQPSQGNYNNFKYSETSRSDDEKSANYNFSFQNQAGETYEFVVTVECRDLGRNVSEFANEFFKNYIDTLQEETGAHEADNLANMKDGDLLKVGQKDDKTLVTNKDGEEIENQYPGLVKANKQAQEILFPKDGGTRHEAAESHFLGSNRCAGTKPSEGLQALDEELAAKDRNAAVRPAAVGRESGRSRLTNLKKIEDNDIEDFLQSYKIEELEKIQKAANSFTLKKGTITGKETGLIQDPAGVAVGAKDFGGCSGRSEAIYTNYQGLAPIPNIDSGASVLNSANKRILHTHAHRLGPNDTLFTAIEKIKKSYLSAIEIFVEQVDEHKQTELNLCPVSAQIFAGPFRAKEFGHLDPFITEFALSQAIAEYKETKRNFLEGKTISLFYYDNPKPTVEDTRLFEKAKESQRWIQEAVSVAQYGLMGP